MRRISLTPPTSQTWKRWINACEKASKTLAEAVQNGEKPNFNEGLYKRKSIKASFFFSKEAPFYGKCAYCETNIVDFHRGDTEHFRPKAAVANEVDEPISHPGYHWLAYDWQNLLPSCTVCNQPTTIGGKKIGKHNRFPVIGQHAQAPNEVDAEKPLLINPASPKDDDDPSKHLAIDIDTGLMLPVTERGRMCIEVFGLNLRDQLVEDRKRAIDQARILLLQSTQGKDSTIPEKINAIIQGKRSYTMASLSVLKKAFDGS